MSCFAVKEINTLFMTPRYFCANVMTQEKEHMTVGMSGVTLIYTSIFSSKSRCLAWLGDFRSSPAIFPQDEGFFLGLGCNLCGR